MSDESRSFHFGKSEWAADVTRVVMAMLNRVIRYLEREFLSNFKNSKIVLLRPTMSFMLAQTPDPTTLKVD